MSDMSREEMIQYLDEKYGADCFNELLTNGEKLGFPLEEVFHVTRYRLGNKFHKDELFSCEEVGLIIGKSAEDTKSLLDELEQK